MYQRTLISMAVLGFLQCFSHFWAVNFKNAGEKKGKEEKSVSFFFLSFEHLKARSFLFKHFLKFKREVRTP